MRKLLALACAFALSACGVASTPPPISSAPPPPAGTSLPVILAPLAGTHVDDEAIRLAWKTVDAARASIDVLRRIGLIVDGTPKALKVADGLDAVRDWLNVATAAQQAGQQATADAAWAQAEAAYLAFVSTIWS